MVLLRCRPPFAETGLLGDLPLHCLSRPGQSDVAGNSLSEHLHRGRSCLFRGHLMHKYRLAGCFSTDLFLPAPTRPSFASKDGVFAFFPRVPEPSSLPGQRLHTCGYMTTSRAREGSRKNDSHKASAVGNGDIVLPPCCLRSCPACRLAHRRWRRCHTGLVLRRHSRIHSGSFDCHWYRGSLYPACHGR